MASPLDFRPSHLDGAQGTDEQRSETYQAYEERVAESVTQRSAKSASRVPGSAGKQAGTVRKSRRPFAVFDIDGTLIRWQLYHAIADELASQGHFKEADYRAVKQARMLWKKREHQDSFKEYEQALVKAVDQVILNITVEDLKQACQTVLDKYKDQVYTYTRQLIADLKRQNYLLFAISASQAEIVALLADYYGFDDYGGSIYEVKNGRFSGQKQVLKADLKPQYLQALIKKHGAGLAGSIGVGDSESDIAMLSIVEQPIAFNPTQQLFDHAESKGWEVVIERKNVIYQLKSQNGSYILAQTNG